jgi:hypothetical protein
MTNSYLAARTTEELENIVINKTNNDVYSEAIDELGKRMSFADWNAFCDKHVYNTKADAKVETVEAEEWICSCGSDIDPEDGKCEQCGKQN